IFLIGGIVRAYGTNAHSGRGRSYVVEADESDKSFTYLSPAAAIVTNIEADHLDHYEGLDEIYAQFAAFLSGVREDGPSSCAAMIRSWRRWPAAPGVR
ncbi:Mur ligase family protein, partial [Adlercreutzia rubneri]|uniref:Mur ligase family protein n=1 Tax=Adlercreutzia rubneri TaxID=2916441 RepID=UPI0023B04242